MVSVYGAAAFLDNRLDNLLDQTTDGLTVYVYDAASPQGESDIVKKYMADPRASKHRIVYYRSPVRTSLYAAWNQIIRESNTEYLTPANADDITDPNYYRTAVELLKSGPNDLVYCPWLLTTKANQKWPPRDNEGVSDPPNGSTCGHFPVWRRSLHAAHGLFDERFKAIGDAEWWGRLRRAGAKFAKIPDPMGCWTNRGADNLYYSAKDDNGGEAYRSEEGLIAQTPYPNTHCPRL